MNEENQQVASDATIVAILENVLERVFPIVADLGGLFLSWWPVPLTFQ